MKITDPILWTADPGKEIYVCSIGARTPLGFNAAASAAAVRGSISAIGEHSFFVDKMGEPMSLASDAGFDSDIEITLRMEQMLVSAIAEALGDKFATSGVARMQCWIGLPEPRPGLPKEIGRIISLAVSDVFGLTPSIVHVFQCGHASGLMAIHLAAQKISAGEIDMCLVACVDSYHDPDTLEWLDTSGLLMSSSNRNGFPPGEAAVACLLANRSAVNRHGLEVLANIKAACIALEPNTIRGNEVCIGDGLSAALKGVSSNLYLPQQAITATYCDLNGERYRNEEFVYTLLRVQEVFVDAHDYLCPADCWGDVGAASGPLFASLAILAAQRGYSKGSFPVLWAGSESGFRAAVLLNLNNA